MVAVVTVIEIANFQTLFVVPARRQALRPTPSQPTWNPARYRACVVGGEDVSQSVQ
jgi:hypothetical protein